MPKKEDLHVYGEFRLRDGAYSRSGKLEIDLVGHTSRRTKPKDDTFDIDNQTLFAECGTPEYDRLKARARDVEKELREAVSEIRKSKRRERPSQEQTVLDLGI